MTDNNNNNDQRERRMFFTRDDDIEMLTLVINENPFINADKWKFIAETLKERRMKKFTAKNVKERTYLLISVFRINDKKLQISSGKEEGYDDLDQLLQEASDMKKEVEENPQLRKMAKKKQMEAGKLVREEAAMNVVFVDNQDYTEEIVECDVLSGTFIVDEALITSESPQSPNSPRPPSPAQRPETQHAAPPPLGPPVTIATPLRPRTAMKKSKTATVQQMWAKLREEQAYKAELVQVERLKVEVERFKAENERKRLEVEEKKNEHDYEIACKRIKLEDDRNQAVREHTESMMKVIDALVQKLQ